MKYYENILKVKIYVLTIIKSGQLSAVYNLSDQDTWIKKKSIFT